MIKGGDFKNHGEGGRKQGRKGRGGLFAAARRFRTCELTNNCD